MKPFFFLFLTLCGTVSAVAQVFSFTTTEQGNTMEHRIIIDEHYLVETQFVTDPPKFISTRGGFYTKAGNTYSVSFEFNSNFEADGLKMKNLTQTEDWKSISRPTMPLDGKWLMGGRVTDQGERRRDLNRPRKTMKFLKDGYFQWIAFNTETFQFFGSGGGTYVAEDGKYTESIQYFSRDNSKSGLSLSFEYEQKQADWYHKGFSSKGDPMHEIWTQRKSQE